jgi:cytochrome c biogenesis protein CcmG, thiol:disulfide interchange protein DsbE
LKDIYMNTKFSSPIRTSTIGILLGLAATLATALEVGQQAPDFDLPGKQGNVKLSDYKGKTVYLDFWASWCGPCKQSFPWMNEMHTKYAGQNFKVVGINVDAKQADADGFLTGTPAKFDVAFDAKGASPKTYGIKGMPSSVLIGPDGKVLAVHAGFKDEERGALEDKIKSALPK